MYMNPESTGRMADERQARLHHEARMDRMGMEARGEREALSTRLRLSTSALLLTLSRAMRPRRSARAARGNVTHSVA